MRSNDWRVPVSVVVPTFNEGENIARCLSSVASWVQEIFIVDSGSSDETLETAKEYTGQIYEHSYVGAPQQWKWALENLPFGTKWVLALDADYAVSRELRRAVAELFQGGARPPKEGYYARHRQIFLGRFLRHGGMYPRYRLFLFRRDAVEIDDFDLVDNRFYVRGTTGRIKADLVEENAKERDLSFWVEKQVNYARRAAEEELSRASTPEVFERASLRRGRNERVLWFKRLWSRLPLYWRSVGYFLYRYIVRLGFLDGKEGFQYHLTQALLFRLMLDSRVRSSQGSANRSST